jgi:catalase
MSPGIEPSADPVLQSRLFSYSDTHRHRIGVNYQQLPVNAPRTGFKTGDFRQDGQMAFYNQGACPNYLSSIEPIQFREHTVNLDKTHSHFIGEAITFLSKIRPEDFNAPRALWEMAFDYAAKARFINNVAGKMEDCPNKEILKRQIAYSEKFTPTLPRALRRLLVSRATTKFLECSPTALTMEW